MAALLASSGGFLLAVLWIDLLFDVQVLRVRDTAQDLPEELLSSIAAYYRRVTTEARPLTYLVGTVMAIAVGGTLAQLELGPASRAISLVSLLLCGGPILLAGMRTYPNAVRLGTRLDPLAEQSRLARAICRDHLLCLGGIFGFICLQVWLALS